MPESRIRAAVENIFKDAGKNLLEERVVDYIVLELKAGRGLQDILLDPYVTNRVPENHLSHLLEHKEIFDAFGDQIKDSFKQPRQ